MKTVKPKFMPGDVILTFAPGWFSRAIRFVNSILPLWRGERVPYSHAALIVHPEFCVEALNSIQATPLEIRLGKESKHYLVFRSKVLTTDEKKSAAEKARCKVGLSYSWKRLALFFLDDLLDTRYFGRRYGDPNHQVCSSFVAWAYAPFYQFMTLSWDAVGPEDIYDDFQAKSKNWAVVDEK